jgi:hypothetical protein
MGTGDGVADAANLAGSFAKDIYLESGLSRHGSDYSAASGGGLHSGVSAIKHFLQHCGVC